LAFVPSSLRIERPQAGCDERGKEQVAGFSAVRILVLGAAWLLVSPSAVIARELRSAAQPAGTVVLGPASLATSSTSTLQNHPACGGQGCTFIQWSGSTADASYSSPVNGTIVAWRIASGSAGNKVTLRVLRPAGGGKYSAVASSPTVTTSGSPTGPDQFTVSIPVKVGDVIGLDNANSALIFKTGVADAFPEIWTPPLPDGGGPSAPTPPSGSTANGYQLNIQAFVQPTATTTTTTTTNATTTTTTTVTTATTTTTTTPTTPAGATTMQVSGVRLESSWRNSRLDGKVLFSVTVRGTSSLTALVKTAGGRVQGERHYVIGRAGTFAETLRLSPGTPPGAYVLRVVGTTGNATPAERETAIQLKPPAEGIVDRAAISLSKGGRAGSTFTSPQRELWVRFHFLAAPARSRTVRIVWRTPSFKLVGAVSKPVATTIDSSLRSAAPLAVGRWYAILSVDGKIVKRIGIRIG
jgi:hypothetical protein